MKTRWIGAGVGAGWSTWTSEYEDIMLFHPKLVEMVEQGKQNQITEEWFKETLKIDDYVCILGASELCIEWIPEGVPFRVEEYDGNERVVWEHNVFKIA